MKIFLLSSALAKQEVLPKELDRLGPAAGPFLILEHESGNSQVIVDVEYFLWASKKEKNHSSVALRLATNIGQPLATLDKKNFVIGHFPLPIHDFHDGYELAGAYFIKNYQALLRFLADKQSIQLIGLPINLLRDNSGIKTPALFLDRDGIINVDINYLHRAEDAIIYEEVIPLIRSANQRKWPVIVISNQSGVARGKFSANDVHQLHLHLNAELLQKDAQIDLWLHCPFHFKESIPDGEYKKHSLLRKPAPGMILEASKFFDLDLTQSFMVGDKASDQIHLPGLSTILLQRQYDLSNAHSPIYENYPQIIEHIWSKK